MPQTIHAHHNVGIFVPYYSLPTFVLFRYFLLVAVHNAKIIFAAKKGLPVAFNVFIRDLVSQMCKAWLRQRGRNGTQEDGAKQTSRRRSSALVKDIHTRLSGRHDPIYTKKRLLPSRHSYRCVVCWGRYKRAVMTTIRCSTCNVYICCQGNDRETCWTRWHTIEHPFTL